MKDKAEIIFAHPNQWQLKQQEFLKDAAIKSGWTTPAGARLQLFSAEEGEAAARYCISNSPMFASRFRVNTIMSRSSVLHVLISPISFTDRRDPDF